MRERGPRSAEHQDRAAPKHRPGVRTQTRAFWFSCASPTQDQRLRPAGLYRRLARAPRRHPHSSCNPLFKVCMQIQRRFRGERAGENRVQGLVGKAGSLKGQRAAVIRTWERWWERTLKFSFPKGDISGKGNSSQSVSVPLRYSLSSSERSWLGRMLEARARLCSPSSPFQTPPGR